MRRFSLPDPVFVAAGGIVYGFGLCTFLLPNDIFIGGASGLASLIARYLPIPVWSLILLLNLPLILVAVRLEGLTSVLRTAVGTAVISAGTALGSFFPRFTGDMLLSAAGGGVIMGLGSGLMMLRGYTSGGSDLAAYLVRRRFPRLSVGRVVLAIDLAVITLSAAVTGSLGTLAYSAICTASYSASLDRVLRGNTDCRLAFIISSGGEAVTKRIAAELERGVTSLRGRGTFTGEVRDVLMCAIPKREEYALRRIVGEADPSAFVIFASGCEVIGEGFGDRRESAKKRV